MWYVYLLKWKKFYVWSTNNLERRLKEHRQWKTQTINNLIWDFKLVWFFEFYSEAEARNYEKKIKKNGHYDRLIHRDNFVKST